MNLYDTLKKNKVNRNLKITIIIFVIIVFLCLVAISFAYISVMAGNTEVKPTGVKGKTNEIAKPIIVTNTEKLRLKLTSNNMTKDKSGLIYYATENGIPVTTATLGNGRYKLATISVDSGDLVYDCNYAYSVSATISKPITDKSDEDVMVAFISPDGSRLIYSLKEVLNGVIYSGYVTGLTKEEDKIIEIEAYTENTDVLQNDLSGNQFTFNIDILNGTDGFSCLEHKK